MPSYKTQGDGSSLSRSRRDPARDIPHQIDGDGAASPARADHPLVIRYAQGRQALGNEHIAAEGVISAFHSDMSHP